MEYIFRVGRIEGRRDMRTQQEIVARMKDRQDVDVYGWETDEYAVYLDAEHVAQFLVAPLEEGVWTDPSEEYTREKILERMKMYMPFALDKAERGRGLSACRSIMHYTAWIWLIGDDDFLPVVETDYDDFGKAILTKIRDRYGCEW
jgi:hypothetical protein